MKFHIGEEVVTIYDGYKLWGKVERADKEGLRIFVTKKENGWRNGPDLETLWWIYEDKTHPIKTKIKTLKFTAHNGKKMIGKIKKCQ